MLCYCLQREIGDWIAPQGYDHADAEANHLIYNADKNKVGISKVPYKYNKPMNTKTHPNNVPYVVYYIMLMQHQ